MDLLSNTLFSTSFGDMTLRWENTPTEIRKILEQSLLERGNDFRSRALSDFIKGTSGMKYRWYRNTDIRTIVYNGIINWYEDEKRIPPDAETVSNIISSFGEMRILWIDLPKTVKECFYRGIQQNFSRFSSQDISKILVR
jgi:hypothetical protein